MPQRRGGVGSIAKIGRDHYRPRWWATDRHGFYRRTSENFRGPRRDATLRLAQMQTEHSRDAPCPTVGVAHDTWWVAWAYERVRAGRLAGNSRRIFDNAYRAWIGPRWGNEPMDSAKPRDLQGWFLTLTPSTASTCRIVMRRIWSLAQFNEAVDSNPFDVQLEMPARREKQGETYSKQEVMRIWDVLEGSDMEGAFLMMAFGGCRVGESLGIRCEETKFGECAGTNVLVAPVRRQVGEHGEVSERLKTRFSRRWIVLCGRPAERAHEIVPARLDGGVEWLFRVRKCPGARGRLGTAGERRRGGLGQGFCQCRHCARSGRLWS